MYFIFLQSTHCIKKTLTVSCTLHCESGDRVKVDKSSFSAYLHAVMLRHHCSEYEEGLATKIFNIQIGWNNVNWVQRPYRLENITLILYRNIK